ncbi:LXG domain-containing protein [Sporosarcina sp. ANT_H38]|uniref:T7SS effector LXG polymorphic toxin n=1 Tax=Sporosarcina sp. ANT_H38 TaxID=2597358 RepID=UPI00165D6EEC|nr:T7SS effector LXG polymorphic toxin [Sporosarcina sp. ANT_H38]
MKIVDVDLFQDGLQRNITMLDRLSGEMEAIHHTVEGLVQMEEQFKGAGGNAIRSFYQECHLPFLHYFQLFSEQFKQVLQQMEAALHSLEPDSAGFILEQFLEGELEQGLTLIGHLTTSLTDEANSIMDQVSDIVGLPHLDDSGVQEGVIRSKRKRDETISQLYEFDATQTSALNPFEQDLQTMNTWLTDMEGLFQAGVKDITFVQSQWNVLTFRSEIRTELFPKVYLNPSDLWIKEQEQLIGTMITAATFQTLEGKKVTTIEENLEENIKYHEYENGLLIKEYIVGKTVFYEVVSKVEYKVEEIVKVDKPKENKLLDYFQVGLDIAGLVPVFGEAADGVNGVIYAARGDELNAALSFGAMIPVAGWASTGGKLALKGNDLNQVSKVVSTEKMASIYSPIYQDVVNSPLGKTQNQLDFLTNTHYQLGTPNALAFNMPFAKTDIPTSIKSGDVDVKVEIKNVDVGAKGTGNVIEGGTKVDFAGKLRGLNVTLEGIKTKEIVYVKRDRTELESLRKEFDNSIRKQFLSDLSKNTNILKDAGFSDVDLLKLQKGRVPDGWQVHHKVPIDDSGTNSFNNLILIQNEPYHKVITNFQNSFAKQLAPGEKQIVDWPFPEGKLYPEKR